MNWVRIGISLGAFGAVLLRNWGLTEWRALVMDVNNDVDEFEEREWLVRALEAITDWG